MSVKLDSLSLRNSSMMWAVCRINWVFKKVGPLLLSLSLLSGWWCFGESPCLTALFRSRSLMASLGNRILWRIAFTWISLSLFSTAPSSQDETSKSISSWSWWLWWWSRVRWKLNWLAKQSLRQLKNNKRTESKSSPFIMFLRRTGTTFLTCTVVKVFLVSLFSLFFFLVSALNHIFKE